MRATGYADESALIVENVVSMVTVGDAVVDDQAHDDSSCLVGPVGQVLAHHDVPLAVATDPVPGLGTVAAIVSCRTFRSLVSDVVSRGSGHAFGRDKGRQGGHVSEVVDGLVHSVDPFLRENAGIPRKAY